MPSLANFFYTQLFLRIPKPATSFAGKTILITGASSGLGKEAAQHFVRLGAEKVILGCRSISKGDKTKLEIESALQCSKDILEVWQVDIESPSSIREFVGRVNKLHRLDVVINNAGMQTTNFQVSYGTERTLAVNVIGNFLLATQLLPKLRQTAETYQTTPHMTFLGSALYDVAQYPEEHGDDIFGWFADKEHIPNMMNQYNLSKLLLLHSIIKLSTLVDPCSTKSTDNNPSSIVINSLDPCFCKTNLPGELSGGVKLFFRMFEGMFARSAEEGARLIVQAASGGQESHGGYFRSARLFEYAPFINSLEGVKRREYIWEQLGIRLEESQPGVLRNLLAA
ncbi:NAD(P)-binding protein [Aspergillus stella-maris]|uniref:NAD(P)-binding protein n=1 Tax=Aspergillus stella-maris TaxID=1810926 RepID=UPI003CCD0AFE